MDMKSAYATSGKIFEQVSKRYQPGMLELLRAIAPGEIVVVKGQYDSVETLLDTIKVPYEMIESSDMATHNGGRVMFVNCKSYSSIGSGIKNSIEAFVNDGGRLVTTDWSLGLAASVFPGKFKKTNETTDDVVEIQCSSDLGRKFIGLNYAQCHPKWWLEGSSHIYDIGDGVTPIITSAEMEAKYGKPYVAAGFSAGSGEVIHFISHMVLQRTKLKTKEDSQGLDAFLQKMNIDKTADMDEAKVAELEAAYSTLNTLAYLSLQVPLLETGMKSVMVGASKSVKKSKGLL